MDMNRFLPANRKELEERGWNEYDFLLVTGDAYVDHPSFGAAVIGRVLEAEGCRVAVLAQPERNHSEVFKRMGRPRFAAFVTAGNLDSMVAHYTAAKKKRSEDFYSPGKKAGMRPDRACIVYANRVKEAFPGLPVILGGLEASLRRFAHYDYWDDKVRRSVLIDARADLLVYGMGETAAREIAARLKSGVSIEEIHDIRGTAYVAKSREECPFPLVECPSYETVLREKAAYAAAARIQHEEHDAVRGRALCQTHGDRMLVVNPPAAPLSQAALDEVAALPFTREVHPMYDADGGVPAIEEVRFSVIHNRGCIGSCNFCSLAFHQGRAITSRSHESILAEVQSFVRHPLFKGYVHDVGGPTANFRQPSCGRQKKFGLCKDKNCLTPKPCEHLIVDHSDYLKLLKKLRAIPGVKKVFIRSGIRFDYLMYDGEGAFLSDLVQHHISGQLKVAPEHCSDRVLGYMGKPPIQVYERFLERYRRLNQKYGKKQFVVPYLMSSHPGSTLQDAVELAEYLHKNGIHPEQVQDFYPTPGTLSTCMYHTGLDPRTMQPVYVPVTEREKAWQRALLQWFRPDRRRLVREALHAAGREDLIGFSKHCLIRPEHAGSVRKSPTKADSQSAGRKHQTPKRPKSPAKKHAKNQLKESRGTKHRRGMM